MTQPTDAPPQWHVRQEVAGQLRTLASGTEHAVREFVVNNFPRPHAQQGQDTPHADVQVHAPDGSVHEFHGASITNNALLNHVAALSGDEEAGWVTIKPATEEATPVETEAEVTE